MSNVVGEGNGNPLQCSCLENPRDRGAWWAAADGFFTTSATWETHVGCIYVYLQLLHLQLGLIFWSLCNSFFVSCYSLCIKVYFFWYNYYYSGFLLISMHRISFILFTFSLYVFLDLLLVMLHWSPDWYSVCQVIHYKITLFLTFIPYVLEGRKEVLYAANTKWVRSSAPLP